MPKEPVWYSDNSVTIYHIYKDCSALKSVRPKDLVPDEIDLKPDGTTDKTGMRLCLICEKRKNRNFYEKYFKPWKNY